MSLLRSAIVPILLTVLLGGAVTLGHAQDTADPMPPTTVQISGKPDQYLGSYGYLYIILSHLPKPVSAIRLAMVVDTSILKWVEVVPGVWNDTSACKWAEFGHRVEMSEFAGRNNTQLGVLRIEARADPNVLGENAGCFPLEHDPDTAFTMRFFVTNDRSVQGDFMPVNFVWYDCDDNILVDITGDTTFVANEVKNCRYETIPPADDFPSFGGLPPECAQQHDRPPRIANVQFCNGGFDTPTLFFESSGDLNQNGRSDEQKDVDLFARWLVEGYPAFNNFLDGGTFASDVNCDRTPLTVEDFACLLGRFAGYLRKSEYCVRDYLMPCTEFTPDDARKPGFHSPPAPLNDTSDNVATFLTNPRKGTVALDTKDTLSVVRLVFDGDIKPDAHNDLLQASFRFEDGRTNVLIHPAIIDSVLQREFITSGELLSYTGSGRLDSVKAATRMGQPVRCRIVQH